MFGWWHDASALRRLIGDLLAAELSHLRRTSASPPEWRDELALDESSIGADSLDRLRLATRLSEALDMPGEGLLAAGRFGEWLEICRAHLDSHGSHMGFRSSGSTGPGRPVRHPLTSLAEEVAQHAAILPHRRRVLSAVPAHHIYGFLFSVLFPASAGNLPVVDLRRHAPSALAALWRPGDLVVAHPDYWREAVRALPQAPPDVAAVTSTAPCPAEVAIAAAGCGLRLVEVFGSTETAGLGWRDDPDAAFAFLPYWRWNGDATVERTLPDGTTLAVELSDRLEAAGSGGFRALGRRDGFVQIGGVNVSLAAVRAALLEQPYVAAASVRPMLPAEGSRLKAFVVPAEGAPPSGELRAALLAWAERALPPPQRPRAFSFGRRLPTDLMGKPADWIID